MKSDAWPGRHADFADRRYAVYVPMEGEEDVSVNHLQCPIDAEAYRGSEVHLERGAAHAALQGVLLV